MPAISIYRCSDDDVVIGASNHPREMVRKIQMQLMVVLFMDGISV